MGKRRRFNPNAICSSYNYEASRRQHMKMLEENHRNIALLGFSIPDTDNTGDNKRTPDPNTLVKVEVWNKTLVVPYKVAEECNYKWRPYYG